MEYTTVVFDGYLEDAANALHHITPYELDECRAIIRAIAEYEPAEKVMALLSYAGVPTTDVVHVRMEG